MADIVAGYLVDFYKRELNSENIIDHTGAET